MHCLRERSELHGEKMEEMGLKWEKGYISDRGKNRVPEGCDKEKKTFIKWYFILIIGHKIGNLNCRNGLKIWIEEMLKDAVKVMGMYVLIEKRGKEIHMHNSRGKDTRIFADKAVNKFFKFNRETVNHNQIEGKRGEARNSQILLEGAGGSGIVVFQILVKNNILEKLYEDMHNGCVGQEGNRGI